MGAKVEGVQPSVLQWARTTAGLELEEVAEKMKRPLDEVLAWESGDSAPTYVQLEKLAYQLYKRPLALFFLPGPPAGEKDSIDFRTLPKSEEEALHGDTRYQIRLAKYLQLSLVELNDGKNPIVDPIFRAIRLKRTSDVVNSAAMIRRRLGVSLDDQQHAKSMDHALKMWRRAVEEAGVYVFKHSFRQKSISGFCLQHGEFPIIYLNNSNTKSRQIFSLMHELCHLLLNVNGISSLGSLLEGGYSAQDATLEVLCNKLAAEILLPESTFRRLAGPAPSYGEAWVAQTAREFRLSRGVILRRLLDTGFIDRQEYAVRAAAWQREAPASAGSGSGNYYATQASYLGDGYMRLVLGQHLRGKLSLEAAADYLGVKTGGVAGLEDHLFKTAVEW